MYIIYCFPEPVKKIWLKKDSDLKKIVLDNYKRICLNDIFSFKFDIVFTDDVRQAERFLTREVANNVCAILTHLIPEDFKIEVVRE